MSRIFTGLCFLLAVSGLNARDFLKKCWEKQAAPLKDKSLTFTFHESKNQLEHSFYPWQASNYSIHGTIWLNRDHFQKQDSIVRNQKAYYSKTLVTPEELLFVNYRKTEITPVSKEEFQDQVFKNARYSPLNLLNYLLLKKTKRSTESHPDYAVFQADINQNKISVFINKTSCLLEKVTILSDDEMLGDVLTTINYLSYEKVGNVYHHRHSIIEKITGKITDTVSVSALAITDDLPVIITRPENYKFADPIRTQPEVSTEKYSDNIYFVELKHANERAMLVEFDTFFLAAEGPLNSKNGELIIQEARKIDPDKPIRYFVFGHYHPHYLGAVRAFIHKGAAVICSDINKDYVRFVAENARTINPDSLARQPRPLKIEMLKDSLTITDNTFEMKIYFIGNKSAHTNDYLICYFPKNKMVFQGDLVWIKKEGAVSRANPRQAGLFHAIKELSLEVETVIQSWPIQGYDIKTFIPFRDLEQSVKE